MPTTAEEWTAQQCADHWGVAVKTWHAYVARNQVPAPVRRVGRTPLWDAEEIRAAAAGRPRAGQIGDIRLPLAGVLRPLRSNMAAALDRKAPADEREASADDALDTLTALRTAMQEISEYADRRAAEEHAKGEDDSDADELRLVWAALADDLRGVDADLDQRRRSFHTATHSEEEPPQ